MVFFVDDHPEPNIDINYIGLTPSHLISFSR
jgi:hypothetical protein